ncbi:MAG TPA: chemotaxis protein CheW [Steroidobacteraceae bacterium]|jgi:purine-binding chemotaxis protein CheW
MSKPRAKAEQILRERAQALARRPQQVQSHETLELLEFRLATERYAVESRFVQEVYPLRDLTPLPGVPPFVLGIVNLRGRILPVFDLKKFFELPEHGLTDLHRIVLVRGNDIELGILADVIVGVRRVAADSLQPSLATLTGIRADYLKGVGDEGLVVLNLDHILSDPRIIVHQEMES